VRGTIQAVERRLFVTGFLHRYGTRTAADGLPAGDGLLACSFWLADAYALIDRIDDARRLYERLLALRNDVGLLAEEYDTRLKRQVGNLTTRTFLETPAQVNEAVRSRRERRRAARRS
jgi:GH15 family glucan-1,4-alpha-glucosidase